MILCSDGSLYTGITNNLPRRFSQHCSMRGAKYFRNKRPMGVVYAEDGFNRSAASQRENAIKKLSRSAKWLLIQSNASNTGLIMSGYSQTEVFPASLY